MRVNETMHALPKLRELRIAKGKSIRGLAREAHVSTESIHRLERGGKARASTRDAFAEALGVHPWKLVFDGDTVDKVIEEDETENAFLTQKMLAMTVEEWDEFLAPANARTRETRRRMLAAIENSGEGRRRLEAENQQDAG
jgi:transcriptional regulator with XRE-family HTH domain